MAKEKLIIDVYTDEARGDQIFFLTPAEGGAKVTLPDVCTDSGIFTDEDDLNAFIEEHGHEFELVKDYRN